jgi:hypothetical protein
MLISEMTDEQVKTLERKYEQANNLFSVSQKITKQGFFDSVEPTIGCDDAVAVKWCGMYLCIETDGYCHT